MPEFCNPFNGLALDKKMNKEELVRAVRFSIAAEFEAIQLYMQIAESIDDKKAKAVMIDVANEEREHVGEFLRLLYELAPAEEKFYQQGMEEVEELLKKL
jgi:rubrerythrin